MGSPAKQRVLNIQSEMLYLDAASLQTIMLLASKLLQEFTYQVNGYPTFSQPEAEAA